MQPPRIGSLEPPKEVITLNEKVNRISVIAAEDMGDQGACVFTSMLHIRVTPQYKMLKRIHPKEGDRFTAVTLHLGMEYFYDEAQKVNTWLAEKGHQELKLSWEDAAIIMFGD